jgi:hypothetical protein
MTRARQALSVSRICAYALAPPVNDGLRSLKAVRLPRTDSQTINRADAAATPAPPMPIKHHKRVAPAGPDPAEQLAQQQCETKATLLGVDKYGPLHKMQWIQGCQPGRIKKIREYANVPQDLLAQQHQADCALIWADALQHMEAWRQDALWQERNGMKPFCMGGTSALGECVFNKKDLLRFHIGDPDRHREDPCTEADLLSRGGAPE